MEKDLNNILQNIKNHARKENIRITQHGQQEMAEEGINLDDLLEAVSTAEIVENYPEHQRGACCLINGVTTSGENLHIVCTTSQPVLIVITVYKPKPPKWLTPTQRRQK